MNKFLLASSILALGATSFAQSYVTSPTGYLSTSGESYAYYFGYGVDHRHQMMDGNFKNSLMVIKDISYRADNRSSFSSYMGMGRTWKNVDLHMATCNYDNSMASGVGGIFTLNATSTPTHVFSGSVTWPTLSAGGNPSPWGGASGEYSFPFGTGGTTSSWIHIGTDDILADYNFEGGSFVNGYTTTYGLTYYLDAVANSSYTYAYGTYYGLYSNSGGCADSKTTYTRGAYQYAYFYAYSNSYGTVSYKNKMRMYSYSYYTGASAPVIHAWALGGSSTGTNFPGVTCQKLFINPALIAIMATGTASASASYYSGTVYPINPGGYGLFPIVTAAFGVQLWNQAAWADTGNGALKLTRGATLKVPTLNVGIKNAAAYQYNKVLKPYYGYGMYATNYYNPMPRYTK